MLNSIKISIIGTGSGDFSLGLIRDLCMTPSLEGSTLHFMDIHPSRLDSVFSLCRRYAEERGVKFDLQKTLNRREALQRAEAA